MSLPPIVRPWGGDADVERPISEPGGFRDAAVLPEHETGPGSGAPSDATYSLVAPDGLTASVGNAERSPASGGATEASRPPPSSESRSPASYGHATAPWLGDLVGRSEGATSQPAASSLSAATNVAGAGQQWTRDTTAPTTAAGSHDKRAGPRWRIHPLRGPPSAAVRGPPRPPSFSILRESIDGDSNVPAPSSGHESSPTSPDGETAAGPRSGKRPVWRYHTARGSLPAAAVQTPETPPRLPSPPPPPTWRQGSTPALRIQRSRAGRRARQALGAGAAYPLCRALVALVAAVSQDVRFGLLPVAWDSAVFSVEAVAAAAFLVDLALSSLASPAQFLLSWEGVADAVSFAALFSRVVWLWAAGGTASHDASALTSSLVALRLHQVAPATAWGVWAVCRAVMGRRSHRDSARSREGDTAEAADGRAVGGCAEPASAHGEFRGRALTAELVGVSEGQEEKVSGDGAQAEGAHQHAGAGAGESGGAEEGKRVPGPTTPPPRSHSASGGHSGGGSGVPNAGRAQSPTAVSTSEGSHGAAARPPHAHMRRRRTSSAGERGGRSGARSWKTGDDADVATAGGGAGSRRRRGGSSRGWATPAARRALSLWAIALVLVTLVLLPGLQPYVYGGTRAADGRTTWASSAFALLHSLPQDRDASPSAIEHAVRQFAAGAPLAYLSVCPAACADTLPPATVRAWAGSAPCPARADTGCTLFSSEADARAALRPDAVAAVTASGCFCNGTLCAAQSPPCSSLALLDHTEVLRERALFSLGRTLLVVAAIVAAATAASRRLWPGGAPPLDACAPLAAEGMVRCRRTGHAASVGSPKEGAVAPAANSPSSTNHAPAPPIAGGGTPSLYAPGTASSGRLLRGKSERMARLPPPPAAGTTRGGSMTIHWPSTGETGSAGDDAESCSVSDGGASLPGAQWHGRDRRRPADSAPRVEAGGVGWGQEHAHRQGTRSAGGHESPRGGSLTTSQPDPGRRSHHTEQSVSASGARTEGTAGASQDGVSGRARPTLADRDGRQQVTAEAGEVAHDSRPYGSGGPSVETPSPSRSFWPVGQHEVSSGSRDGGKPASKQARARRRAAGAGARGPPGRGQRRTRRLSVGAALRSPNAGPVDQDWGVNAPSAPQSTATAQDAESTTSRGGHGRRVEASPGRVRRRLSRRPSHLTVSTVGAESWGRKGDGSSELAYTLRQRSAGGGPVSVGAASAADERQGGATSVLERKQSAARTGTAIRKRRTALMAPEAVAASLEHQVDDSGMGADRWRQGSGIGGPPTSDFAITPGGMGYAGSVVSQSARGRRRRRRRHRHRDKQQAAGQPSAGAHGRARGDLDMAADGGSSSGAHMEHTPGGSSLSQEAKFFDKLMSAMEQQGLMHASTAAGSPPAGHYDAPDAAGVTGLALLPPARTPSPTPENGAGDGSSHAPPSLRGQQTPEAAGGARATPTAFSGADAAGASGRGYEGAGTPVRTAPGVLLMGPLAASSHGARAGVHGTSDVSRGSWRTSVGTTSLQSASHVAQRETDAVSAQLAPPWQKTTQPVSSSSGSGSGSGSAASGFRQRRGSATGPGSWVGGSTLTSSGSDSLGGVAVSGASRTSASPQSPTNVQAQSQPVAGEEGAGAHNRGGRGSRQSLGARMAASSPPTAAQASAHARGMVLAEGGAEEKWHEVELGALGGEDAEGKEGEEEGQHSPTAGGGGEEMDAATVPSPTSSQQAHCDNGSPATLSRVAESEDETEASPRSRSQARARAVQPRARVGRVSGSSSRAMGPHAGGVGAEDKRWVVHREVDEDKEGRGEGAAGEDQGPAPATADATPTAGGPAPEPDFGGGESVSQDTAPTAGAGAGDRPPASSAEAEAEEAAQSRGKVPQSGGTEGALAASAPFLRRSHRGAAAGKGAAAGEAPGATGEGTATAVALPPSGPSGRSASGPVSGGGGGGEDTSPRRVPMAQRRRRTSAGVLHAVQNALRGMLAFVQPGQSRQSSIEEATPDRGGGAQAQAEGQDDGRKLVLRALARKSDGTSGRAFPEFTPLNRGGAPGPSAEAGLNVPPRSPASASSAWASPASSSSSTDVDDDEELPMVMISYKRQEKEFAVRVRDALAETGKFRVWVDTQIRVGRAWREEIAAAIEESVGVVFVLSPLSLQSRYCREELYYAVATRTPIYPLMLEDPGTALKGGLRMLLQRIQWVDFVATSFGDGMRALVRRLEQDVQQLFGEDAEEGKAMGGAAEGRSGRSAPERRDAEARRAEGAGAGAWGADDADLARRGGSSPFRAGDRLASPQGADAGGASKSETTSLRALTRPGGGEGVDADLEAEARRGGGEDSPSPDSPIAGRAASVTAAASVVSRTTARKNPAAWRRLSRVSYRRMQHVVPKRDVFISCAMADVQFVRRLAADLGANSSLTVATSGPVRELIGAMEEEEEWQAGWAHQESGNPDGGGAADEEGAAEATAHADESSPQKTESTPMTETPAGGTSPSESSEGGGGMGDSSVAQGEQWQAEPAGRDLGTAPPHVLRGLGAVLGGEVGNGGAGGNRSGSALPPGSSDPRPLRRSPSVGATLVGASEGYEGGPLERLAGAGGGMGRGPSGHAAPLTAVREAREEEEASFSSSSSPPASAGGTRGTRAHRRAPFTFSLVEGGPGQHASLRLPAATSGHGSGWAASSVDDDRDTIDAESRASDAGASEDGTGARGMAVTSAQSPGEDGASPQRRLLRMTLQSGGVDVHGPGAARGPTGAKPPSAWSGARRVDPFEETATAIEHASVVVFVMSPASAALGSADEEVHFAYELEKEILVLKLGGDWSSALPAPYVPTKIQQQARGRQAQSASEGQELTASIRTQSGRVGGSGTESQPLPQTPSTWRTRQSSTSPSAAGSTTGSTATAEAGAQRGGAGGNGPVTAAQAAPGQAPGLLHLVVRSASQVGLGEAGPAGAPPAGTQPTVENSGTEGEEGEEGDEDERPFGSSRSSSGGAGANGVLFPDGSGTGAKARRITPSMGMMLQGMQWVEFTPGTYTSAMLSLVGLCMRAKADCIMQSEEGRQSGASTLMQSSLPGSGVASFITTASRSHRSSVHAKETTRFTAADGQFASPTGRAGGGSYTHPAGPWEVAGGDQGASAQRRASIGGAASAGAWVATDTLVAATPQDGLAGSELPDVDHLDAEMLRQLAAQHLALLRRGREPRVPTQAGNTAPQVAHSMAAGIISPTATGSRGLGASSGALQSASALREQGAGEERMQSQQLPVLVLGRDSAQGSAPRDVE